MKRIIGLVCAAFLAISGVYAQSEITVKRAKSSINAGFREQIYIDGSLKLTLVNGTEGKITVSDGEHTMRVELSMLTAETRFNVRSGSVIFTVTPYSTQQIVIEQQNGGSPANTPSAAVPANRNHNVEGSLERAAKRIIEKVSASSRIAIVYVTAADLDVAEFIANELEFILVDKGFMVIDRSQLDRIRQEQNLQISGEIDDTHAVSIGKFAGANVIITGAVTGSDNLRRLRLRALDTQTAQVLTVASEQY